ncbi:hypothetical protein [Olleya sp. R77988]
MKRVTFVFIGLVAIFAYLITSKPKFETKIAQAEKVMVKKHPAKTIYD